VGKKDDSFCRLALVDSSIKEKILFKNGEKKLASSKGY